jgi:hypothetical protein
LGLENMQTGATANRAFGGFELGAGDAKGGAALGAAGDHLVHSEIYPC